MTLYDAESQRNRYQGLPFSPRTNRILLPLLSAACFMLALIMIRNLPKVAPVNPAIATTNPTTNPNTVHLQSKSLPSSHMAGLHLRPDAIPSSPSKPTAVLYGSSSHFVAQQPQQPQQHPVAAFTLSHLAAEAADMPADHPHAPPAPPLLQYHMASLRAHAAACAAGFDCAACAACAHAASALPAHRAAVLQYDICRQAARVLLC